MSTPVASCRTEGSRSRQVRQGQFGVLGSLVSGLRKFKDDRKGDVAMMFGLMALIMMLFVGGAVDFGRWLHASKQTKNAIDAAVLAGGRVLQLEGNSAAAVTAAKAAAMKYYTENVRTRIAVINDTVAFDVTPAGTGFTASGNAYLRTPILALANISQLPLLRAGAADFSIAKLATGGNAQNDLEISVMLDTSGSMSGTKISDMKLAAKDLVDIVVWDNQSTYTSKVAIAPFSADVILPASMNLAARGNPAATKTFSYTCSGGNGGGNNNKSSSSSSSSSNAKSNDDDDDDDDDEDEGGDTPQVCSVTYQRTPCVVERKDAERYTDAAPGDGTYVMTEYTSNGNCSQPLVNAVVPLSNDKTALKASIDGLVIAGATAGHLGTAWAWYTLSPNWANVFPASSQPKAYGAAKLQKIAILMTDGEYNTQYTVEGIRPGLQEAGVLANGSSVTQAKALCDGMKQSGITVYTVGFDLGGNQTAINTLNYCASSAGHAYNADGGAELRQAFRDIGLKISTLYLSQ